MKKYCALLFCFLVLLTACGKREENTKVEKGLTTENITITVQGISFIDYYTKYAMEMYEAEHPNVKFEILDPIDWNTKDIGLSKVYTEMSKGEGPDILIAEREELEEFIEKGCILDISDAFSKDTRDKLINSVTEYGSFGGNIYLAPNNLNTSMLIVSDSNISGDSWTISEFISIIEKREQEGNGFEWIVITDSQPCEAVSVFALCMRCIDASSFIDWENKSCSFDDPLFVKLLEISKKYDDYAKEHKPVAINLKKELELLEQGKVLAVCSQTNSLYKYSEAQAILGDGYTRVGYPCDEGNGRRCVYATNLAVNKNTENSEVIKDFINFYYSLDICVNSGAEVRTDIYDGRIAYDEYTDSYGLIEYLDDGRTGLVPYVAKESGSTYIEEYFELLNTYNSASLENYKETQIILDIVYEEAGSYFDGDKSAEEVAKLIQARVTLLLQE